ncbi:hypothetical protein SVAN01_06158 [Stagonosporopsis vannaccii]|nr:hypothetical protein SVAN01_06158 [Stagonosporopsis vannaccii]
MLAPRGAWRSDCKAVGLTDAAAPTHAVETVFQTPGSSQQNVVFARTSVDRLQAIEANRNLARLGSCLRAKLQSFSTDSRPSELDCFECGAVQASLRDAVTSTRSVTSARQRANGGARNPSDVDRKSVESGALPQTSANKCKRVNNSGTTYQMKGPNMVVSQGPGLIGPSSSIGPLAWNSALAQTFPRPWAWSSPPSSLSRPAPASYAPFASCAVLLTLLSCRSLLCPRSNCS